jgi:hypothetical protein
MRVTAGGLWTTVVSALCAAMLTLLAGPSPACAGLPLPEWRTLETPHFRLNYPVGLEAVAYRAARICEEAHEALVPMLHHRPTEKTEVSLSDFGDSANGSATALPSNRMNLLAAPPGPDGNLGDFDDWLRQLIYHEYTHILHLDTIHGWPEALNHVFGKKFAPNQNMPSFLIEGVAVYVESRTSGRGRVRSAMFRGWLRTAALADALHDLDVATHFPQSFPGPNVWYMYGGHFMEWLARRHGSDALARMFAVYGRDVIPFAVNRAAVEATGEPLTALWAAWQNDVRAEARRWVATRGLTAAGRGLTEPMLLTDRGERHENPRFLPDGALLAIEGDAETETDVYERGPDGRRPPVVRLHLEATERFDVCRRTGALVFDQVNAHGGAYAFTDLFLFDGGRTRRLSRGARIRDPACDPAGRFAIGVQITAGRTRLVRVDVATGEVRVLHDPGRLDLVAHPAVSPDGRRVAFVRLEGGRRDVAVLTLDDPAAPVWLTQDDALELRPRFTPDGQAVLYASDRSGVFEIYLQPLDGGAPRRLTNSLGGVVEAEVSPDGHHLATVSVTAGGLDLGWMPFDPDRDLGHAYDLPPGRAPRPDPGDRPLPSRPYAPAETLWPTVWAPKIALSSPESNTQQVGLLLESTDALAHHALLGDFTTRPDAGGYATRLAWGYRRHIPNFALSASHETRVRDGGQFYANERHPLREDVSTLAGSVGLFVNRSGHAGSLSARLTGAWFHPAENPTPRFDPLDAVPVLPEASRTTDLSIGLSYRHTGRTLQAVSDESGLALSTSLRLRDDLIGSDSQTAEAFLDYRHYVDLWWRHVLALRLSSAFGVGDDRRGINYALGPAPERNLLLDALDQIIYGSTFFRGFPAGTATGSRYALVTAEYRLPLWELYRGFSMVPAFFRHLKLSVFTDWAQARRDALRVYPSAFRKSAGIEISAHALLGWRLPLDGRIGYAKGFGARGEHQTYFFLGNWF